MARYKAILFDMDGTLVNTEPLHEEAWHQTLAKYNLKLSKDWFHKYTGSTDRVLMTEVAKQYQVNFNIDEMLIEKRDRFLEMAKTRSEVFEGVKEGLTALQDKYDLALVTSSSRIGANCVLVSTELLSFFKTTITFDDVNHHKPHPEPYEKAIHQLGVKPKECIAVEDSISGTKSAKAAGCHTVGVLNSVSAAQLVAVDNLFENTQEVMQYLLSEG